ncbi:MAG: hypothetical protein LBS99_03610 [Clostridiales bacterium]|jgi:hypothetical protein|nr:hypothetical protein [Clostridiales bacterium]
MKRCLKGRINTAALLPAETTERDMLVACFAMEEKYRSDIDSIKATTEMLNGLANDILSKLRKPDGESKKGLSLND